VIPLKDGNPTATFPFVTTLFILINIALFVYELSLGGTDIQPFVKRMAVVPHEIVRGVAIREYPTLVTSMFLHGGLLHLLLNMLFLWIFGNNIEDALGHVSFVIFYLLCGIAASLTHAFLNASSDIPVIGASGAISGILGAYLILYPRARVQVALFFIRVVRGPAWFSSSSSGSPSSSYRDCPRWEPKRDGRAASRGWRTSAVLLRGLCCCRSSSGGGKHSGLKRYSACGALPRPSRSPRRPPDAHHPTLDMAERHEPLCPAVLAVFAVVAQEKI
jgi:membrane associated rhomboid family serine protease